MGSTQYREQFSAEWEMQFILKHQCTAVDSNMSNTQNTESFKIRY